MTDHELGTHTIDWTGDPQETYDWLERHGCRIVDAGLVLEGNSKVGVIFSSGIGGEHAAQVGDRLEWDGQKVRVTGP